MVEFGNGADRFPADECVAILAGNVQISVRTARDRRLLSLRRRQQGCNREDERTRSAALDSLHCEQRIAVHAAVSPKQAMHLVCQRRENAELRGFAVNQLVSSQRL